MNKDLIMKLNICIIYDKYQKLYCVYHNLFEVDEFSCETDAYACAFEIIKKEINSL